MTHRSADQLFCGVDVGASSTKLVLLNENREIRGRSIRRSGVDYAATARACLEEAADAAGADVKTVLRTVSTGYGRRNVEFSNDARTELSCHGVGPSPSSISDARTTRSSALTTPDGGSISR